MLKRRLLLACGCILAAALIWLPLVRVMFRPRAEDLARAMAARQVAAWSDLARPADVMVMRRSNAEWDFMGRTFFVLALANLALAEPDRAARHLALMDRLIDDTLRIESERGMYYFLMDYARANPWVVRPERSQFVDGEIALMLAARQLVSPRPDYARPLAERVNTMTARMRANPVLSCESYPDECWAFCNSVALAAIAISDRVDGRDHGELLRGWVTRARAKLIHEETGLLVSSYTADGRHMDGPEGSSIWMMAHCLQVVDPDFAADQYRRAREELGVVTLGFGYAREWPASWRNHADVDSGAIIPVLDVSAGASGMACLGAAAFGDEGYLHQLLKTLELAAFPIEEEGGRRYAASNLVGDAVLLYALIQGPLWKRVRE